MLNKTADTILDEPIELGFDIKPDGKWDRFCQWIGVKPKYATFKVKGATLRNMIRISRLLLKVDLIQLPNESIIDWGYRIVLAEAERMADIIAIAIHNSKSDRPQYLVDLILDNFDSAELKAISNLIMDRLNVSDFIGSIASVRTINLLTEASPERPEIIAEPIVISGEQSEELKGIFDGAQII